MADLDKINKLRSKFTEFGQATSLSRSSAPLIVDVGQRALLGAMVGFSSGFVFFKAWSIRMFMMFTGLGVGLGLNYSQMNVLYHASRGTLDVEQRQEEILEEIEDLQKEMNMRNMVD
mgnify:FL=1|tara:strand:- start:137 stop:487 length:351 start_codon:yes stop_codon:yes gene_type:complete